MKEVEGIEKIELLKYIYDQLQDKESKDIYEQRINYSMSKNENEFCEWIINQKKKFYCPELDDFEKTYIYSKDYILFGAGYEGKLTKKILESTGRNVVAWSDNNIDIWNKNIEGIPVLTPTELMTKHKNCAIIITSNKAALEIYRQLLGLEIERKRIFISQKNRLLAFCGNQYFDVFKTGDGIKEKFVDGGGFNIETSLEFVKWCNGNYSEIFIFEPDSYCFDKCKKLINEIPLRNITIYNNGLWSKTDELSFWINSKGSSRIDCKGSHKIKVVSIDEVLQDTEVTFIKLDIEGSELEALKGAKETIKKYRPKLAICIYHKIEDLWEIPKYILDLVPDYKLYVRHYTTYLYETVIYAQ